MGTRNLTVVVKGGVPKVAQYGQWDGYPEGQGTTILAFLSDTTNTDALRVVVDKVEFISSERHDEILAREAPDILAKKYINQEESDRLDVIFPSMSRDIGGKILELLVSSDNPRSLWLHDSFDFGKDSLFCEWAYVVDLYADSLDVYKGFQKETHQEGIWSDGALNDGGYAPIRKVIGFPLGDLPSKDTFLAQIHALLPEEDD